jgi:hypothetical protein
MLALRRCRKQLFDQPVQSLQDFMVFLVTFVASPLHVHNPYLKGRLVDTIQVFTQTVVVLVYSTLLSSSAGCVCTRAWTRPVARHSCHDATAPAARCKLLQGLHESWLGILSSADYWRAPAGHCTPASGPHSFPRGKIINRDYHC